MPARLDKCAIVLQRILIANPIEPSNRVVLQLQPLAGTMMQYCVPFKNIRVRSIPITCDESVAISPIRVVFDLFVAITKLLWMFGMQTCPIDVLEQAIFDCNPTLCRIAENRPPIETIKCRVENRVVTTGWVPSSPNYHWTGVFQLAEHSSHATCEFELQRFKSTILKHMRIILRSGINGRREESETTHGKILCVPNHHRVVLNASPHSPHWACVTRRFQVEPT